MPTLSHHVDSFPEDMGCGRGPRGEGRRRQHVPTLSFSPHPACRPPFGHHLPQPGFLNKEDHVAGEGR